MDSGRRGALVVSAWHEDDGGVRARITRTTDLHGTEERVVTVASPEEVLDAVREWLDDLGA